MAKLKDLLKENFSLVGGIVSTPVIGNGTNTGLTDIVEDMYGKSESRVSAKEVKEAISQFTQYSEVFQQEENLKKIAESLSDIANKAKDYKDAINKITNHAKGTSGASKKFADAIDAGKFTDWEPSDDVKQEVEDFIKQRDRVKKMGPRANDPDQNLLVQIRGAADLRTGSNIKLDDGSTYKLTQKNAKIISMAMDKVKPQMKKQLLSLLGKNKASLMRTLGAIKRSMT